MPRSKKEEEQVETPVSDTEEPEPQPKKTKRRKKDKKAKKKKKVKEPVSEAEAESESEEAEAEPTPVKKSKKKKAKKTKAKAATTTDETPETESKDAKDAKDAKEANPEDQFTENRDKTDTLLKGLIATVQERIAADKALLSCLRELNRQVTRERKEVSKVVKKLNKGQRKKRRGGNKSPGGFTKPAPLSGPMCAFLEVAEGTELPRTEVTRRVNRYVKENDLQNPENKKQILADGNLKSLLYLKDDDELTYFNLQRYMKIHFLKKDPETGEVRPFTAPVAVTE
jgi:upstream activation factor subunit UAF30